MGSMDVRVGGFQCESLTIDAIPALIGFRQVGDGVPAAYVAPCSAERNHGDIGMALHDGVVNAFGTAGIESLGLRPNEGLVMRRPSDRLPAAVQDVRRV